MRRIIKTFLVLLFFVILISCEKSSEEFIVKYEVKTSWRPSYAMIEWTTVDGAISGGNIENINWVNEGDTWTYSFKGTEGLNIYFTGLTSSSFYKVKIRLYINDELVSSAESSSDVKAIIEYTL
jgi:hypothetical protein